MLRNFPRKTASRPAVLRIAFGARWPIQERLGHDRWGPLREVILGGTGGYRGYATFGPQIPLKMFAPSGVGKTNAIEAMIFFISTSSYSANEHAKLR